MIYDIPGVYTEEIKPTGAPVKPIGTGTVALVGKFEKGPVGKPTRVGNMDQLVETFGLLIPGSAAYDAYFAFKQGAPSIVVVRVEGTKAGDTVQNTSNVAKLRFTARVDGSHGNNIHVKIENGTITDTYKVTVKYDYQDRGTTKTYSEVFDNLSLKQDSPRYIVNIINAGSYLVRVEDLAPGDTTPIQLINHVLGGGLDPAYSGTDTGIELLQQVDDVNILITDSYDSAVRSAQLDHCAAMGDRITVLNPNPYMTVAEVKAVGDALDDDRGILTYPWVVAYDPAMNTTRAFRPAAFYAGVLAALDPYLSPSNHKVYGALDLERSLSRSDLVDLQNSKISPIYWWGTRGIRIRNGINLSSDPNLSQISRRRMTDWIQESVEENFAWAVSKPHTPELRDAIKASLTKWFRDLVLSGWIQDFFVKCDEENNPPEVVQAGKLVVRYGVRLWRAADYIVFRSEIGETVETQVE